MRFWRQLKLILLTLCCLSDNFGIFWRLLFGDALFGEKVSKIIDNFGDLVLQSFC
jgi:hypothetical protein